MKDSLREFRPDPIHNTEAFRVKMIFLANVQRRRLLAGEITEAEALGAEAHVSAYHFRGPTNSTGSYGQLYPQVKQEPGVFALRGQGNNGSKYDNSKGTCHHCKEKGHFIAQCPRKASGLAPTVQHLTGEDEEEEEEYVQEDGGSGGIYYLPNQRSQGRGYPRYLGPAQIRGTSKLGFKPVNSARGKYSHPNRPYNSQSRGQNKKYNGRIGVLYEDESGNAYFEECTEPQGASETETVTIDEQAEGVNMLQLEEDQDTDFSEADFLPAAFLGL
jgi:hypothetical protein